MKALRAILWLDWRSVRRDFAVLAGVAVLAPALLGRLLPPGATAWMFGAVFVTMTASLLGATLGVAEPGLEFVHARALRRTSAVLLRLLLRCWLSLLLALFVGISTQLFSPDRAVLALFLESAPTSVLIAVCLVAGFTTSGALAGAFTRQAVSAVFGGFALLGGLTTAAFFGAFWIATQWSAEELQGEPLEILLSGLLLHAPLGATLLVALGAVWALCRRTSAVPLPMRRPAALGSLLIAALALVIVAPPLLRAHRSIQRTNEAWAEFGAPHEPTLNDWEQTRRDSWQLLESLGLRREGLGRTEAADRLNETGREMELRVVQAGVAGPGRLPLPELRRLLAPVERDLAAISRLVSRPDLSIELQAKLAFEVYSVQPLLLARAALASADGDAGRSEESLTASWMLVEPFLAGRIWPYYLDEMLADLRALLLTLRDGAIAPDSMLAAIERLETRSAIPLGAAGETAKWSWGSWWEHPRKARMEAEQNLLITEWLAGLEGSNRCELADASWSEGDRNAERIAERWNRALAVELEAELTVRVLARRAGDSPPEASRCDGARWVERDLPNGSWSIGLEHGPLELRHVELPPG